MARLRVFVSSTCYDLAVLRNELRPFIASLGHDAVMSEYADILYHPSKHTHASCAGEVANCDIMIVVVGGRYGGEAFPDAVNELDLSKLEAEYRAANYAAIPSNMSITQLEVFTAIVHRVPIYVFVDQAVLHDELVYRKNHSERPATVYPSIEKQDTAKHIFEFIYFLKHRTRNNAVVGFSDLEAIRSYLRSQWSQYFKSLLDELRRRESDETRYREFSDALEEIKATVMASIPKQATRKSVQAAIRFRHLVDFAVSLAAGGARQALLQSTDWNSFIQQLGIVRLIRFDDDQRVGRMECYFELLDGRGGRVRGGRRVAARHEQDFEAWLALPKSDRDFVVETLVDEDGEQRTSSVSVSAEPVETLLEQRARGFVIEVLDL